MFRKLNCKINPLLSAAALILLVASPVRASTAETPLTFVGFAFSGDYNHREQLYPYTAKLSAEEGGLYLDRILREKLTARPELAKRLGSELADGKRDISTVAFALVNENFEVQRVEGKYWVILTIQANVLAFNKASKSVVASYPVRMRVTQVSDAPPSPAEKMAIVRAAYTSANARENMFDHWLDRFSRVHIRDGATLYVRVTDVSIAREAEKTIVEAGSSVAAVRNQVANLLEAAVGEAAQISIVPHAVFSFGAFSQASYVIVNGIAFCSFLFVANAIYAAGQ